MNKPKKLSAMDLLVKSEALKPALSQSSSLSRSALANLRDGTPVEISPQACRPWMLADRPEDETAHKDELIRSFQQKGIGQIQPIVVRTAKDAGAADIRYEVICGRVRWLAAKELGIPIQAIVRELDDKQAFLTMSAENRQRKNISDYAKAKSYRNALALGLFESSAQLAEAEGLSKSKLSQFLGFAELPEEVAANFADISKIPYRLGYEINKACKMLGLEAILPLIPKIESGELSRSQVQAMQVATTGSGLAKAEADEKTKPETALGQHRETSPYPNQDPQLKRIFVSSTGRKLFTYNQASRGWLIRMAPEISLQMDEELILKLGDWLETNLQSVLETD